MENKLLSLGTNENNRFVKIIRIIFGAVCITVAIYWLIYNIRSSEDDITTWITILFLSGFGFYQIWAGLGRATKFIEIGADCIRLKKNTIFPPVEMIAAEIEKIELFPLKVVFFLKTGKRVLLRFGTTYYETNEKITVEIMGFAESNKIPVEIIEEEL